MFAPEKITFYCKPYKEKGVYPAYPVDSSVKHDGAKCWAAGRYSWRDSYEDPLHFEWDNSGFDNVTIESLDIRGEGGRAYQVIVERDGNRFKVDLREPTLMEVILTKGIQAGGRLNGSFCFAKEGSQTKLILEGSDTHKAALAEREKRQTYSKKISNKDLKPGYLYQSISGKRGIYLGNVHTYGYDENTGKLTKPYKALLFVADDREMRKFLETGEVTKSTNGASFDSPFAWEFYIVKSHSYKIEKEKVLDVDLDRMMTLINDRGRSEYERIMELNRYSHYLRDYFAWYELARMRLDKKELDFKDKDIQEMKYKAERRGYFY